MDPVKVRLEHQTARDKFYLKLAYEMRGLSKCLRAKYGAVLVSYSGRISSTGVNGKPRGSINDHICYREGFVDNAAKPNCCIHAEVNCLLQADVYDKIGATLYVSGIPCTDCALIIMQSQLNALVVAEERDPLNPVFPHQGNADIMFFEKYGVPLEIRTYTVYCTDDLKYLFNLNQTFVLGGENAKRDSPRNE